MVRAQDALVAPPRHRPVAHRRRWLDGRHAGPRVGGHVPDRVRSLAGHRHVPRRRPRSRSRWQRRRSAIGLDPKWRGGDYYDAAPGDGPHRGLALARQSRRSPTAPTRSSPIASVATIADVSRFTLWQRFDVEGYLDYHGAKLVRRFDANSYLVINRAMDLHDLGRGRGGVAARARRIGVPSLDREHRLRHAVPAVPAGGRSATCLAAQGAPVEYVVIDSPHGHDAFLLETDQVAHALDGLPRRQWRRSPAVTAEDQPLQPEPETIAIRPGRERHASLAPILWATTTFVTPTVDEGRRMATMAGAIAFYSRYGNPTVCAFEDAIAAARRRRGGAGLRVGHGRDQRGRARRCARRATTSSRSASSTPARSCCCSRPVRASASTSRSSTAPSPARSPPRCVRARRARVRRDAGEPAPRPRRPRRDRRHRRTDHRRRLDVRHAARAAPLDHGVDLVVHSATKAIAGHNDATLGVVAGRRSSSTGCGASPCCRAPTPRRSTP